ncbi:MAG TPA: protoporphyrinogen oxidase [Fimbriiglobus sp.]|nr:protoporphyrinogen oxidase [Fimbriiglobus sp.]
MSRVVVVGAGLSGLAVAFRLRQARPELELTLLEGRDRPGGTVWTEHRDGFRLETGPNGFLDNKPGAVGLCRDLGLDNRLVAASEGSRRNRFVYIHDRLHKLPSSPPGILTTPLLSVGGKLALLREPFRRRPADAPADESVTAFARRRFGKEAADVFMDALVTGIYAGDPEALSVRACFPRLAQFEDETGSVLRGFLRSMKAKKRDAVARGEKPAPTRAWSFREGLRALVEALAGRVSVKTGVRVTRVERTGAGWRVRGEGNDSWEADAVVLACPAYEQATALADLDAALADDLAAILYNRVAVVGLGYRQADAQAPDGFGYIAPQHTRRDVLGVQWCSSIYPDRAPPGFVLWRVLCGGAGRPEVFDRDDDALIGGCHREMQQALGVRGEPVFRQVVRWPRAIPQYHVGHLERVTRVEAAVGQHPGLFVAGNALHGVSMPDVAERAAVVAERVGAYLANGRREPAGGNAPPAG